MPSCKEASFAGTILPPSSPPSSPIEPALSTRDVWRWRSLINSKDRPRPPCGKLPLPPLSFQSRRDFYSTLAPGLRRKEEKNTIVALRRIEWRAYKERERERREIHRSNRYLYLFLSLSLFLIRWNSITSNFCPSLYLQGNKSERISLERRRRVSRSALNE